MRKLLALIATAVLALTLTACGEQPTEPETTRLPGVEASHGSSDQARTVAVELKEINRSGISGQVTLRDDGSSIVVDDGSATGMDPANSGGYLSLFYDKASPPNGPEACEPGTTDPDHPLFLTDAQMAGAIWLVDGNGDGTPLDLAGEYVPVDRVGTMSIRDLRVNEGFGPEAVVACGKVTHGPGR